MMRASRRCLVKHRIYRAPAFRPSLAADPHMKQSLSEVFEAHLGAVAAPRQAEKAFTCIATKRALSFAEVRTLSHAYSAAFVDLLGVKRGDVVCLLCPNSEFYCSVFHALLRVGAVVSPVNTLSTPEEIDRHMDLAGSALLITSDPQGGDGTGPVVTEGLNARTKARRRTLHLGRLGYTPAGVTVTPAAAAAAEAAADEARRFATPDATIVLPFSSGTTGLPKGVQLTNQSLIANYLQVSHSLQFAPTDVGLSILPFFHIYGMLVLLHCVLLNGGMQVTFPRFDMEQYLGAMAAYKPTLLFVAPPVVVGLIKHPRVRTLDTSSVRWLFSAAAPLRESVQRQCEALFPNATIGQGYGLTETSPLLTTSPPKEQFKEHPPYGSAGMLVADTEARIVDIAAERAGAEGIDPASLPDVPDGEEGELSARGPQTMKGYLKAADTAKVFVANDPDDGPSRWGPWFRTGDIVRMRPGGHLEVTDRLKDLIKYKGYQVAPAELEALLQSHHDIQDAVVVGIPAPVDGDGEVPAAWVVLKPGLLEKDFGGDVAAAEAAFVAYVAGKVNPFKQLRGGVTVVDAIPKTASGKLLRRNVRDAILAKAKK